MSDRKTLNQRLHTVSTTEHCWIPMRDGIKLSARIWRPVGEGPFPAILEYIPYRKRDMVRARDERNHPFFAANGYVCLRVDMRGSGDSEGDMPDMYAENELADARQVIEWIASQDWCSGSVGMFGTSWGGTASLQAAVDAPLPLKAVIANCATANRFEDDIHWMGGGLLTDSFEWGATLPAILAAPPSAETVCDAWFSTWKQRLATLSFPLKEWIQNDTRGSYWRHGSVSFSADRLTCPILAIGGWSDRYSNSVFGLVSQRPDLCRGIVGPWGHHYPDHGEPGPAISFQEVALEWWDRWLKDKQEALPDPPLLRLWRREFDKPQDRLKTRAGRWIEIIDLPKADQPRSDQTIFFFSDAGLTEHPVQTTTDRELPHDPRHGECAGDTGYFGRPGGLPLEQSADDARSLCFDSPPLERDIDLIGYAEISLVLARNLADAQIVCRLCEVTPDGQSLLVTRQPLNLALDEAMDEQPPFDPDTPRRYRVQLPSTAYRFGKGNRIRIALAGCYWPLIWPASEESSILLSAGESILKLPSVAYTEELSTPLPQPQQFPANPSWTTLSDGPLTRIQKHLSDSCIETTWEMPWVTTRFGDTGESISIYTSARYRTQLGAAPAYVYTIEHNIGIERADGNALVNSFLEAETKEGSLSVKLSLEVSWNGDLLLQKSWRFNAPNT